MARGDSENTKISSTEKLLVLSLIRQGLKQDHVAAALGMHRTSLSRAFPKGILAEVGRLAGRRPEDDNGQEAS